MCMYAGFQAGSKNGTILHHRPPPVQFGCNANYFFGIARTGALPFGYLCRMGEYSLGDALRQFLKQSRLKGSVQAMQIQDVWEQIMGKTVARYTDSIKIYGRKLYVTTSVAPLKQELIYQKDNIIQRVNEALGEKAIDEVIIS